MLADWMAGAGALVPLADVAHTLNHHRAQQATFATVCAADRAEAVAGLRALAAGQSADRGGRARITGRAGRARCSCIRVRVRSGQGWAGSCWPMSRLSPPPSRSWSRTFVAQVGFSLQTCSPAASRSTGIERIQPVLVGVQLALTALWRSYGVEPMR